MEDKGPTGVLAAAFIVLMLLAVAASYMLSNKRVAAKKYLSYGGGERSYSATLCEWPSRHRVRTRVDENSSHLVVARS